jgi:hypothetical protein
MTRLLTIVATVVLALAVSAAPAMAATSGSGVGRVGGKMHLDDISMGIITDKSLPNLVKTATTGTVR